MPVGTTAKDAVVAATLGNMEIVDTAVDTIEDMVVDLVMDTDLVMDMDMDIETVVTLGTILATEIQVTDMEVKRLVAIIVAATEVVIMVMIGIVVVAIVTHGQDTNPETETITANAKDSSIHLRINK
jgi:hypothetical protein